MIRFVFIGLIRVPQFDSLKHETFVATSRRAVYSYSPALLESPNVIAAPRMSCGAETDSIHYGNARATKRGAQTGRGTS